MNDGLGQYPVAPPFANGKLEKFFKRILEDGRSASVGGSQPEVGVESEHTGRKIRQHTFKIAPRRFKLLAMSFGVTLGVGELPRHAIERLRQHTQFVGRFQRCARREIARSYRASALGQNQQGLHHTLGKEHRDGDGGEQREQQSQR